MCCRATAVLHVSSISWQCQNLVKLQNMYNMCRYTCFFWKQVNSTDIFVFFYYLYYLMTFSWILMTMLNMYIYLVPFCSFSCVYDCIRADRNNCIEFHPFKILIVKIPQKVFLPKNQFDKLNLISCYWVANFY